MANLSTVCYGHAPMAPPRKLSNQVVLHIRKAYQGGASVRSLAIRYDVSRTHIQRIVRMEVRK